jgi:hypothetical protein
MALAMSSAGPTSPIAPFFLTLPPIADRRRRVERQLWREFEVARPRILGSLLDAAAHGLRNVAGIQLEELPRMADFALWATACETAFWPAGTFTQAYQANRRAPIEDLIDGDRVAVWVRQIMANRSTWTGSASDLLVPVQPWRVSASRARPQLGLRVPGNLPADCVVRRHSFGYWASTSPSVVRAELEPESSGSVRDQKIPSAPSASSAITITIIGPANRRAVQ